MITEIIATSALAAILAWGVIRTHMVTIMAVVNVARMRAKYSRMAVKSAYYWVHRNSLPRCLRWIVDWLLSADTTNAALDNPTRLSDSVRIQSAILRTDEHVVELAPYLTKLVKDVDVPGARDKVMFCATDLVPSDFMYADETCTIDVRYKGHSNPAKKIPAKDYFVRYVLGAGEVGSFPPYGVRERQIKGFGVKKVRTAVTQGASPLDVTKLALACAGPRYNFYTDCEDESVAKNFIGVNQQVLVTYGGGKNNHNILLDPGDRSNPVFL